MSADCEDDVSSPDSNIGYHNCVEYARITCGNEHSYSMITETITIGRNSSESNVDVDVGPQTFVSRKHLQVNYSHRRLHLKCLGKNGVFVDNIFRSHSSLAYELPTECTLRFPSTNVELVVQQLAGRCSENRVRGVDEKRDISSQSGVYVCVDDEEMDDGVDLYLSGSTEEYQQPTTSVELGRETVLHRDMAILSKCPPTTSMSTGGRGACSVGPRAAQTDSHSLPPIVINPRLYRSCTYGSDLIYGENSQLFGAVVDAKDLAIDYGTETQKPPYSYAQLIVQAVSTCANRQLTLNGIYNYISKHYPYFKCHDKGWQNSVRHNLSLNRYFIKVPRAQDEPGKGSFWRIDAAYEGKLIAQAFRKRRLRSNNGACVTNDGLAHGSGMFTVTGARASNMCTFSDRGARLSTIYAVKRADHKTTFVIKKINEAVSQNVISVVKNSSQSLHVDKNVTSRNVFHGPEGPLVRRDQKTAYGPSIHVVKETLPTANRGTLVHIDGNLYSTGRELQSIQVISSSSHKTNDLVSFVPAVKSRNKCILISSSRVKTHQLDTVPSVCITSSGSLYRPTSHHIGTVPSSSKSVCHQQQQQQQQQQQSRINDSPVRSHRSISPMNVTTNESHNRIFPVHCSSEMVPPSSQCIEFPQSIDPDDDLDMDQFLVSSPIMHHSDDLDTSPDLYDVDDTIWHDSLVFHDAEIEGH